MVDLAGSEEASTQDGELVFDDELMSDSEPEVEVAYRREDRVLPLDLKRKFPSADRVLRAEPVQVGELLVEKYRVERVHRPTALGVTVNALHEQLGQRVALRLLTADPRSYPDMVQRFLRGARRAGHLQNEHTVRVLDIGTLPWGVPYVVTEHLSGSDLRHVLRVRDALLVSEAVDYALQVCESLAEAHALGLVHRNLTPSNVFLTRRSGAVLVKVLDLALSEDPLGDAAANPSVGSPALKSLSYLAPEQIRDPNSVDSRADIWALGALLHEMLTGSVLYEAETMPALLAAIAADPPAPITHLRAELPAELEQVVLRCLAKERGERYSSVAELALSLAAFASAEGQSSVERIELIVQRRSRSTRPPPLPGAVSKAIVRVPAAKKAPTVSSVEVPHRRWVELALTGVGFGCAAAAGAWLAIHSMEHAFSVVSAPRQVVAELSPALTAGVAPANVGTASVAASSEVAAKPVVTPSVHPQVPRPAVPAHPRAAATPYEIDDSVTEPKPSPEPKPVVAKNAPAKDLFDDAN